ncbi:Glycosyl hydrolase, five-bladed beta-propellor domain containing protein [Naviculisporaceae sp. PSN 640]
MVIISIIALLHTLLVVGHKHPRPDFGTYPHGNPFVPGTFGYPDAAFYHGTYWLFHADYPQRKGNRYIDAYSSRDLKNWRHRRVLSLNVFSWATLSSSIVSVSTAKRGNQYYLYFNTVDRLENSTCSIGIGVSSRPQGPYRDALGTHLLQTERTLGNPGGTSIITDDNGQSYLYYIDGFYVQVAKLTEDMVHIDTANALDLKSSSLNVPIYGGIKVFKREDTYYMMYRRAPTPGISNPEALELYFESGTDAFPEILYATSKSVDSGFSEMSARILWRDDALATEFGQATVINVHGTDIWYIVCARKFVSDDLWAEPSMSGLALDPMYFEPNATIRPVLMTVYDNFDNELHDRAIWTEYWANYSTVTTDPNDDFTTAVDFSRLAWGDGDGRSMLSGNFGDLWCQVHIAILDCEYELQPGSYAHAGLVFRVENPLISGYTAPQDDFEGYYAGIQIKPKRVILGLVKNGTWTELKSAKLGKKFNVSDWNLLAVQATWKAIQVFVGDRETPKIRVENGEYLVGQVGLRAYNTPAKFDNFWVFPGGRGVASPHHHGS